MPSITNVHREIRITLSSGYEDGTDGILSSDFRAGQPQAKNYTRDDKFNLKVRDEEGKAGKIALRD